MAKEIRLELVRRDEVAAVLAAVSGGEDAVVDARAGSGRPALDGPSVPVGRRDAAGQCHRPAPPRPPARSAPSSGWRRSGASWPTRSSTCTARSTSCMPWARFSPRRRTAPTWPPARCGGDPAGRRRRRIRRPGRRRTDRGGRRRRPGAGHAHTGRPRAAADRDRTATELCSSPRWPSGAARRDRALPPVGHVRGERPQAHRSGGGPVRGRPRTPPRGGDSRPAAAEREASLRRQLDQLRIELDAQRQAEQVEKVTETDYFGGLRAQASDLRRIIGDHPR